jgi:hypothetical protein
MVNLHKMASLVSVIEIWTKFSELHHVQVLLAICRGCFLGKIGHNLRQKTAHYNAKKRPF